MKQVRPKQSDRWSTSFGPLPRQFWPLAKGFDRWSKGFDRWSSPWTAGQSEDGPRAKLSAAGRRAAAQARSRSRSLPFPDLLASDGWAGPRAGPRAGPPTILAVALAARPLRSLPL